MTEKLYTDRCGAPTGTDGLHCMLLRGHTGQHDFRITPDEQPRVFSETDLRARLALLLQQVAEHWPTVGYCFSLYSLNCSCGQRLEDSWKHVDPEKFRAAWKEHILSLSPDLDKALDERADLEKQKAEAETAAKGKE